MPHDIILPSLIHRLMSATSFEDAATFVLQAALACAEAALAVSPHASRGRLQRAIIHLRPDDSYQRLFGIEHPEGARSEGAGYLTSANVWRWLVEHRCSVSIDVQLAILRPWLGEGGQAQREPREPDGLPSQNTRERMIGREATHVHVVPLRAPGGEVHGMLTLEASCKAAMGQEFIWASCYEDLELIAGVSAGYLMALPARPVEVAHTDEFLPVVGAATARLIDLLRVFARQQETILISGPTGAGKSRLARWCHENSRQRSQPFETLDLLSVPEELQMAELFGWRRGAFTGAMKDTPGALARAEHGTLFIDEIDKLSLKAQAGLLRVLEEHRYRPLGDGAGERQADVRFIVGTNADLRAAVRAGRFREDLYYRINVLPIRVPPLEERLDELPLWASYMLAQRHREAGNEGEARLTPDASKELCRNRWPGNLRQLNNLIRRAYAFAIHDQGEGARDLTLRREHIQRALAHDAQPDAPGLIEQLRKAASAFAREAALRDGSPTPLPFHLADAFRGMVLEAGVEQMGTIEDAFRVLKLERMVTGRNHHKVLKREQEHIEELLKLLEVTPSGGPSATRDES